MKQRRRPEEHIRKIKTVGGTKFIIINKGIRHQNNRSRKTVGGYGPPEVVVRNRREAIKIIKEIMAANRSLARERAKIALQQSKLKPLSLSVRDDLDRRENDLQKHARINRAKIRFLEKEFDIRPEDTIR